MALPAIVCDNGTGFVKCGYAGSYLPSFMFPSMVGRPTLRAEEDVIGDVQLKDIMVGDEAEAARRALTISYPVENGKVRNWEDMEHLWNYIFHDKMKVETADRHIMLTEAPLNPKENRVRTLQTMFEKYRFQGVRVDIQALLVCFSQGLMEGVVVDAGDGVTHVVPVMFGTVPTNLIRRLDIAGRNITDHLLELLQKRGYSLNKTADFYSVQQMKERFCYVAMDAKQEERLAAETTCLMEEYRMPDGRQLKLTRERFEAAELLFKPPAHMEQKGVSDMVFDMIQEAPIDTRSQLYKHILLSGGSTMFPGFSTRLHADISQRYLKDVLRGNESGLGKFPLRIEDPPRRKHMVYMGASVSANVMRDRADYWMSRAEFEEHGAERLIAIKSGRIAS